MSNWPDVLQAALKPEDKQTAEEKEQQVLIEMRKLYAAEAEKRRAARAAARRQRAEQKQQQLQQNPTPATAAASGTGRSKGASTREIPRFYVQRTTSPAPPEPEPPAEGDGSDPAAAAPQAPRWSLPMQVRRESRTRYLESRAEQLLDDRELAMLWDAIQANSVDAPISAPNAPAPASSPTALSPPPQASPTHGSVAPGVEVEKRLSYEGFLRISATLPAAKAARYFKPSLFLSFPQDGQARISSRVLWRLVSKKIQLTRLRISLTCYDDVGYGYLREQDLENYVYDQLGSLPPLASVERDFYPYYVFTAVRKFIFALDGARRGKLRIRDIVHSAVMLEFDALRYPHGHHAATKKNSWFSAAHTQEVYAVYLGLDANQNGMLSREEFRQYNGGSLTNIFIDGLFAEYRMYPSSATHAEDGGGDLSTDANGNQQQANELEMDYKTFLDFVLAMEYKQSAGSISYFFRILDARKVGYLDAPMLQYWFRAVNEKMAQLEHEQVNVHVVASEIFDMVSPATPGRITLSDLISSKCGHTVISILIDVNGFWKYDNRENLMHSDNAEDE